MGCGPMWLGTCYHQIGFLCNKQQTTNVIILMDYGMTMNIPILINSTMHWTNIPQCTFCNRNVHTCAHFCYKMVHCGIQEWCMVGSVQLVYRYQIQLWHQRLNPLLVITTMGWCILSWYSEQHKPQWILIDWPREMGYNNIMIKVLFSDSLYRIIVWPLTVK